MKLTEDGGAVTSSRPSIAALATVHRLAEAALWSERRFAFARIAAQPSFSDGLTLLRTVFLNARERVASVICVPMRDEAEHLPGTLDALGRAIARDKASCAVVLVANDTSDASVELAAGWAERTGIALAVFDVTFALPIRNAAHARRLALDLGAELAPDGALLTTDADTLVDPDWIVRTRHHLERGADLVCGAVGVDAAEIAGLPDKVRVCGDAEARLFTQLETIWTAIVPDGSRPFAIRAMGASLALPTATYRALGGLPTPGVAEDRALAERMQRQGMRIVAAHDVRVTTSCRLVARAEGGMGDALIARITEDDPLCDAALVPLDVLLARARTWRSLYEGPNGPETNIHAEFATLCEGVPALRSQRMRMRAVMTEGRRIEALQKAIGNGSSWDEMAAGEVVSRATFELGGAGMLLAIAGRAAAADRGETDLSMDIDALRSAGWLAAGLPRCEGGLGWGSEPSGTAECLQALREIGRANLSVARLFEGHVNAVKLVALYGSPATRARAFGAVRAGALMGVWGADVADRPLVLVRPGGKLCLRGAKRFASGLGLVTLAIVNARTPDGPQLVVVPTDARERADPGPWRVSGMKATASGVYDFESLVVPEAALLGSPGDYLREPYFEGGIWRYCAAHLGGAEALYEAMRDALVAAGRAGDPHQEVRIATAAIAVETARLWVERAAGLVEAEGAAADVAAYALLARQVTEDACRSVIHSVEAALGMGAHFDGPVERMRRDLALFLCQAAPDAKRARAAQALVARAVLPEAL